MDATITSIAKKAGVSHSTVSRALADSPLTSSATKERIRRLAEEAGYRPHRVARSLVTGKTQTLGFVITNLKNPFFAELTDRLHRATRERGYQLLVALDDGDQAQRLQQLDYLTDRRVDGILAWTGRPRHHHPCFRSPRGQRTPFVVLGTRVEDDATSFVATDRPAGMEQAVEHLTRLGLTRIGYVGCDMESPAPPRPFSKYAGFLAAMERRGLRPVACIDHRTTGRNSAALCYEAGYEAGRKLAADPQRPRAVVCDADTDAIGLMAALRDRGVRVPGDVAVVGFDGIAESGFTSPRLTTVAQPVDRIVASGLDAAFHLLAEPEAAPQRLLLAPSLVVRESCGAARATGAVGPAEAAVRPGSWPEDG